MDIKIFAGERGDIRVKRDLPLRRVTAELPANQLLMSQVRLTICRF
jgi:hypothetical protein